MFQINEDSSIYITRGDVAFFRLTAMKNETEPYMFQPGDVVRFKVFEKKGCENVAFQKDFGIEVEMEAVDILLTENETKIGEVISKPTDYWYEVELNPLTSPQTIIGYGEDGPMLFRLYPEGADVEDTPIEPEDIPVVDDELDLTSTRPVQNQAIARAILKVANDFAKGVVKISDDGEGNVTLNVLKGAMVVDESLSAENAAAEAKATGAAIEELKKSVADGKELLAGTISEGGVETASDATFDTMNTNMQTAFENKYNSGYAAGSTADGDESYNTGYETGYSSGYDAGVEYADGRANIESTNYQTGYDAGVDATMVGDATAAYVYEGKTFTCEQKVGVVGTMPNNGAWKSTPTKSGQVSIPKGYHNGNGYVDTSEVYNAGVAAGGEGKCVGKSGNGSYTAWSSTSQTNLGKSNKYTIETGLSSITSYGFRCASATAIKSFSKSGGTITFEFETPSVDATLTVYWCAFGS